MKSETTVTTGSVRMPVAYSWRKRSSRPVRRQRTDGKYATAFAATIPAHPTASTGFKMLLIARSLLRLSA